MTISFLYSNTYTFLVKKYTKEVELEAKIISNIAESIVKKELRVFIPNISKEEKNIYSKYLTLSKGCNDSNFVYIKVSNNQDDYCKGKDTIFFTNNYRNLLKNNKFVGAFFWNKSRPNIIFFKKRLLENKITLPRNYNNFIEE